MDRNVRQFDAQQLRGHVFAYFENKTLFRLLNRAVFVTYKQKRSFFPKTEISYNNFWAIPKGLEYRQVPSYKICVEKKVIPKFSVLLQNKEVLQRFREAMFNVAFANMAGLCSVSIIHIANIRAWIWMNSGAILDLIAELLSVLSPASYAPWWSSFSIRYSIRY